VSNEGYSLFKLKKKLNQTKILIIFTDNLRGYGLSFDLNQLNMSTFESTKILFSVINKAVLTEIWLHAGLICQGSSGKLLFWVTSKASVIYVARFAWKLLATTRVYLEKKRPLSRYKSIRNCK
jgi:hypothetical protein